MNYELLMQRGADCYVRACNTAEKISDKRVKILEITEIDDEPVKRNMSRTGAKRQQYSGTYFADAERGKTKNISSLLACKE